MKYRAGHGEEAMTAAVAGHCNRARNRLGGHELERAGHRGRRPLRIRRPAPDRCCGCRLRQNRRAPRRCRRQPKTVYARYRQGTAAASRAYWAAHEAPRQPDQGSHRSQMEARRIALTLVCR